MQGKSIYKVPGGKMLRINLEYEEDVIKILKINGDFFLFPEEKIDLLESEIAGLVFGDLDKKIEEIVRKNNLTIFGFSPADLVKAILLAKESKS